MLGMAAVAGDPLEGVAGFLGEVWGELTLLERGAWAAGGCCCTAGVVVLVDIWCMRAILCCMKRFCRTLCWLRWSLSLDLMALQPGTPHLSSVHVLA